MKKILSKWDKIDAAENPPRSNAQHKQEKSAVSILNEACQRHGVTLPKYYLVGADDFGVIMEMDFMGKISTCPAQNKKQAKNILAKYGINQLMHL